MLMKHVLMLLLLIPLVALGQQDVYKHVDSSGKVTFSDKPKKDAKRINVDPVQTFKTPQFQAPMTKDKSSAQKNLEYESISISKPEDGATIWNNPGNFMVDVATKPRLQPGDKMVLMIDGRVVGESDSQTRFELTNINRGEHSLSAHIVNAEGDVVITSKTATIHLHQASVNMPSRR